jgi:hypothetical protein
MKYRMVKDLATSHAKMNMPAAAQDPRDPLVREVPREFPEQPVRKVLRALQVFRVQPVRKGPSV